MVMNDLTLGEMVVWDRKIYPSILPTMIQRYGEGPFMVVGLRLFSTAAAINSSVASYIATVELPDGTTQGLAGEWFARAKQRTECSVCHGVCIGADA